MYNRHPLETCVSNKEGWKANHIMDDPREWSEIKTTLIWDYAPILPII